MSKLVRSRLSPDPLYPDVVRAGSVRLLCRWDVREIEVEDEMAGTYTEYEYAEQVIWWALPSPEYLTRQGKRQVLTDAGRVYLASVAPEIMGWAMAAAGGGTLAPGPSKDAIIAALVEQVEALTAAAAAEKTPAFQEITKDVTEAVTK